MTVDAHSVCGANDPCDPDAGDTLAQLTDIRALFTFGQEVVAGTGINLGLEGLPLSVEAGVEAFADWSREHRSRRVARGRAVHRARRRTRTRSASRPESGSTTRDPPTARDRSRNGWTTAATPRTAACAAASRSCSSPRSTKPTPARPSPRTSGSTSRAPIPTGSHWPTSSVVTSNVDFTLDGTVHLAMHIRTGIGEDIPDIPTVLGTFPSTGKSRTSLPAMTFPTRRSGSTTFTSTSARS